MTESTQEALKSNEWLAALPEAARSELIEVAKIRRLAAQQRVHSKGEPADGLYGLLSGEVRVSASTYAGDHIVVTRLLPGQWFGEIAILDGGARTHDAMAEVRIAVLTLRSSRYGAIKAVKCTVAQISTTDIKTA